MLLNKMWWHLSVWHAHTLPLWFLERLRSQVLDVDPEKLQFLGRIAHHWHSG
eukprot:m.15678 g.15678  ORF g.15678 m.15678 type:complete len:52 (+) comp10794_c0_seq2:618-773(+)